MQEMQHNRTNRGQAYAIEGIIGAIIVVSSLVLGLQAVDMSTWSDGGDGQTATMRTEVADTLDVAQDTGALQEAVTCVGAGVNPKPHRLVASTSEPASAFGQILRNTTGQSGERYRYRIAIDYPAESGPGYNTTQIGPTPPEQNRETVTVSQYVTLTDRDPVFEGEDCAEQESLAIENIYIDDQQLDSELYAVVRVRITVWS